jgi:hypothetical protein
MYKYSQLSYIDLSDALIYYLYNQQKNQLSKIINYVYNICKM